MSEPIDKGSISIAAFASVLVLGTGVVFGIGGGVAYWEARLSAVEAGQIEDRKLMRAICKALNCDGKGMRE